MAIGNLDPRDFNPRDLDPRDIVRGLMHLDPHLDGRGFSPLELCEQVHAFDPRTATANEAGLVVDACIRLTAWTERAAGLLLAELRRRQELERA